MSKKYRLPCYTCSLQSQMKLHRKIVLISIGKLPDCPLLALAMLSNSLAGKDRVMAKQGKISQEYVKSTH